MISINGIDFEKREKMTREEIIKAARYLHAAGVCFHAVAPSVPNDDGGGLMDLDPEGVADYAEAAITQGICPPEMPDGWLKKLVDRVHGRPA